MRGLPVPPLSIYSCVEATSTIASVKCPTDVLIRASLPSSLQISVDDHWHRRPPQPLQDSPPAQASGRISEAAAYPTTVGNATHECSRGRGAGMSLQMRFPLPPRE